MKATRRSACDSSKRSLAVDTAKLDLRRRSLIRCYLSVIIDAHDRTILHHWISSRPPDARDVQKALTRFVFK
jgi:hypothetical protein